VVGLGAGLYPTAARALISDLFVDRRGQAFGLHTALGDLGNATAAGVAVAALLVATWQAAFLPVASVLLMILITVHFWNQELYVLTPVDLGLRSTGHRLFEKSRMRWLLVAYALYAFTWQSIAGFLPTFLQIQKEFSVSLASTGFAALFIIGAFIKPVSGLLGDRFGRLMISVNALGIGITGLMGILVAERSSLIFLSIGVFAVGLMAFPPVMQAYLMDIFPAESMGGDLGAMRTIYIGFGSIGPTYVGYVAGVRSYIWAFAGLVVCMLVSAGVVISVELFD
jgi:MFS family permease